MINCSVDNSMARNSMLNEYYLPGEILEIADNGKSGFLKWYKHGYEFDYAFKKLGAKLVRRKGKEVFQDDYEVDPIYKWSISFPSIRTLRLQLFSTKKERSGRASLMVNEVLNKSCWKCVNDNDELIYSSQIGSVIIDKEKFGFSISDTKKGELFRTVGINDNNALHQKHTPSSLIKNAKTNSIGFALSTSLKYDERIYGCGESFTGLNKKGQKILLDSTDVQSALTSEMYKPIPFFVSDRGYGVFVHSSAPLEFDFGFSHSSTSTLWVEDEVLDVFIFIGSYKEILREYTSITGRSPLPPVWSFGLWMSRLSYDSQNQILEVAKKLREYQIPSDIIHIDARWFQNGLNCDYKFSDSFEDPEKMICELSKLGFKTSLWQIPYFNSNNSLYDEIVEKGLYLKQANGLTSDIVLDFSNLEAQQWYASKIEPLLDMGVAVIKADFGEEAPKDGLYASNQSGLYEHNLYPLRYTSVLSDILKKKNKDTLIWARSAWAGSQRYPVHWSGDSEISNHAMANTLRAGLSFGLSGFTFWSHDIGGFSGSPQEDLFLRWTFMGMFSSHSRIHGLPPREPWFFSNDFMRAFRSLVEMRYCLLPYILTQSAKSCEEGFPLIRPLFFEFQHDVMAKYLEDQYMFGDRMLIAPLFEDNVQGRKVYLPDGEWVDYFELKVYKGGSWYFISSNFYGIVLIKMNSCIPHVRVSQSTSEIDWSKLTLKIFSKDLDRLETEIYMPKEQSFLSIKLIKDKDHKWQFTSSDMEKNQFNIKDMMCEEILCN